MTEALRDAVADGEATHPGLALRDVPVVFLSYDEPWADDFWHDLQQKAPRALRVHNVKGLDACHKAAARAAGTDWFLTVDADTVVDPAFFDLVVPATYLSHTCRVDWASRNDVNGLLYGNGSVKLWPHRMVMAMRTHEAAPKGRLSVDHDIGKDRTGTLRVQMPGCFSVTRPAESAFHAFRCGFREGARLGMVPQLTRPQDFGRLAGEWKAQHLKTWCSVGAHTPHGAWVMYGARLGLWMLHAGDWDVRVINDYTWIDRFWSQMILPRFVPGGSRCPYTGAQWDAGLLAAELTALGRRIEALLDFELVEFPPETSRLMVATQGAAFSPSHIDTLGYMHLKGMGVTRDLVAARELFETGLLMNLSGSYNNLARMHEQGLMPDADLQQAIRLFETAIALGNAHAPYHLAQVLLRRDPLSDDDRARAAALIRLSAERGYAPAPADTRANGTG
jgi:hypothetical protein